MKTIITFTLFALSIFLVNPAMAQSQTEVGTITGNVSDSQSPKLYIKVCDGKSMHDVPPIDANLVVIANEDVTAIEDIQVITGAYDTKYQATVIPGRPIGNQEIGRFTVMGHPKGTYQLVFTVLDNNDSTATRQKNRRVEMKIIFN